MTNAYRNLDDEDVEWTPRDLLGRPIGIWRQGPVSEGSRPCAKPYQLFGYNSTGFRGSGYDQSGGILDCPVIRWRDTDGNGSLDETVYYLQDFRGDINALAGDAKSGLLERVRYGPTGRPEAFPAADVNFDGIVESDDQDQFEAALSAYVDDPANYDPRADLDRDGDVDGDDETLFLASYDKYYKLSGNWKLSQGDGITPGATGADAGLDNRFGWRGYWYDQHLQKYHVRNRVYDPREGRWMQTDPIGFAAGDMNLYRYCDGQYSMGYDPLGLLGTYGETWATNMDGTTSCEGWTSSGDPNAGNRHDGFENFSTFMAGWADGLSFGLANEVRGAAGWNDSVDRNSSAYRAGAVTGAINLALIAGAAGGEVAAANWGLRGTYAGAWVGGAAGGMVGDVAFQGSMMANGLQQEYNPAQTLIVGAFGGILGSAIHTLGELAALPSAAVDMRALAAGGGALSGGGAAAGSAAGAGAGGGCGAGSATPWAPVPSNPTVYSASFQMTLNEGQFGLSQGRHFQIANQALQAERAANPVLAEMVPAPTGWGKPPAGWTWQHATIAQGGGSPGVMQLVPRWQHAPGSVFQELLHPLPNGGGGYIQWAVPAGAPPR